MNLCDFGNCDLVSIAVMPIFWLCIFAVFLALARRAEEEEKHVEGGGGGQVLEQTVLYVPAREEGRHGGEGEKGRDGGGKEA